MIFHLALDRVKVGSDRFRAVDSLLRHCEPVSQRVNLLLLEIHQLHVKSEKATTKQQLTPQKVWDLIFKGKMHAFVGKTQMKNRTEEDFFCVAKGLAACTFSRFSYCKFLISAQRRELLGLLLQNSPKGRKSPLRAIFQTFFNTCNIARYCFMAPFRNCVKQCPRF